MEKVTNKIKDGVITLRIRPRSRTTLTMMDYTIIVFCLVDNNIHLYYKYYLNSVTV